MESTPVSRAGFGTRCGGMRLQAKNAEFGCGWFGVSFFHLCRVTELKNHSNHFFLCFNQESYGTGVK